MADFQIVRTSEGVWGKEVNIMGERPYINSDKYTDFEYFQWSLNKWEEAESQLQEYPLTEESQKDIEWRAGHCWMPETGGQISRAEYIYEKLRKEALGQLISGEIVVEDGIKKIKIAL